MSKEREIRRILIYGGNGTMKLKNMLSVLLCSIIVCLSACGKPESNDTSNVQITQGTESSESFSVEEESESFLDEEEPKNFSDEEEFENYSTYFWICEENYNDSTTYYKIRFFFNKTCYSWDFSYSSTETLTDCLKKALKLGEEKKGQTFKSAYEFLLSELNVEGVESQTFDVQYDVKNSQINNSSGQTYGKFLNDGTFKCNGDIYNKDENLSELGKAFIMAKGEIFTDTYGELATYEDVKYDPFSYLGKKFMLIGTAELDDYYNYDYRDLESVYFCIQVTPIGGNYSDCWYIYAFRDTHSELYEKLKKGAISNMVLICSGFYPDSLKKEMANLVEYCY